MRKNFILTTAALVVLTLAGCQKTEPAIGLGDDAAIGFAPYVSRDVTKASVTDITASNLASFNVACYLTGTATAYFDSEQSASKNAAGYWETADAYYWLTNTNFDFFAYSGSGSDAVSNTGGVAKVSYTVPDAATEDFIVASAISQGKPSSSPYAQSLSFSHALSKVSRITLAPVTGSVGTNSKYKYIVTDVKIVGAKNSADYTFNPASGSNWGTGSGEQDYAFEDNSFSFLGDSSHTLEVGTESKVNDQLIILPQTATLSVTYSVEYSYDGGTTWGEIMPSATKTAEVEMEVGKAYNIKLQLPNDASPIVFSSNVAGWGDAVEVDKEIKKNIALSGNFTVNSSGDKVRFSPGNLYYTGSEFKFEETQYAYTESYDASHVCRFRWAANSGTLSSDISSALSTSTSTLYGTTSDVLFTNATQTTPRADFTVEEETGKWRTLSQGEWSYLLITRKVTVSSTGMDSYGEGSVNGKNGFIILPDNWDGSVCSGFTYGKSSWSNVFTESTTPKWSEMESAGCVFLLAVGYRSGSSLFDVGSYGSCWSSTCSGSDSAYYLYFITGRADPARDFGRNDDSSVRLVCAVQ